MKITFKKFSELKYFETNSIYFIDFNSLKVACKKRWFCHKNNVESVFIIYTFDRFLIFNKQYTFLQLFMAYAVVEVKTVSHTCLMSVKQNVCRDTTISSRFLQRKYVVLHTTQRILILYLPIFTVPFLNHVETAFCSSTQKCFWVSWDFTAPNFEWKRSNIRAAVVSLSISNLYASGMLSKYAGAVWTLAWRTCRLLKPPTAHIICRLELLLSYISLIEHQNFYFPF